MTAAAVVFILTLPCPEAQAALRAAAGKIDITPDLKTERAYLAGYGARGRRAAGVRDRLFARAVVVSDGKNSAAIVSLDNLGLKRGDALRIESASGLQIFLTATHTHSGPDLLGLWGPLPGISGVDHGYKDRLIRSVSALIRGLAEKLEPAELHAGTVELDPSGLCKDRREPVHLDPMLGVFELRSLSKKAIATGVRWSCHATAIGRKRDKISADFPGELCSFVEEKNAGTCLFLPGSIGGHLIPDADKSAPLEEQEGAAFRIGRAVAEKALAVPLRKIIVPALAVSSRSVSLPVSNSRYLGFLPGIFRDTPILSGGGGILSVYERWGLSLRHLVFFPLPEEKRPFVESAVTRLSFGSLSLLGLPGESFPESSLGVGKETWIVNLVNDEIGYLVPKEDFVVAESRMMLPVPPGHYDETNSLGPEAEGIVFSAARELIR